MQISRRDFLKYCGVSAAALGLTATDLLDLEQAIANPNGPSVIWLQGASCTGCSVSFLNRISPSAPSYASDLLINSINLVYHPNLMGAEGELAVKQAQAAYNKGGYVLVVEGGVPTAFSGNTCWPWTFNGQDVTFQQAVTDLAGKAAAIVCVGTCAAFGGMAAAPPNPTGVKGVKALTGKATVNVAGCPPHPDWIFWTVAQLLAGKTIPVDSNGRPTAIYGSNLHANCPRNGAGKASSYGSDKRCLMNLGCRGPVTNCRAQSSLWNNRVNWCVDANAPCIGCTSPTFPGSQSFKTQSGG